jgi:phosphoribosylanthranilate isomerase
MFIKICGITSVADARLVAEAGAQAIGLNFYAASPRCVQPVTAHDIIQNLPPFVEPVGLFVNSDIADIRQWGCTLGLRTLQLHGNVSPKLVAELREFSIIAAFPLTDRSSAQTVLEFVVECQQLRRLPSAVLLDAASEGKFGGTGQTAPWPIARSVVEQCPIPVILAGGLTAKNIAQAIHTVQPWGVDVASGVEVAPGRKESYKVRMFVEAARRAAVPKRG